MSRLPVVLIAPIAVAQARGVRAKDPGLQPPPTPWSGAVTGPDPLRLLVVGDSTAVGTGVERSSDALAGQLAALLGESRGATWRAIGRSGATSGEVLADFGAELATEPADVVVLLVGWNDALQLVSGSAFARHLGALLDAAAAASPSARLVVVSPPAFADFAVLPQPLRAALGSHARGLARVASRVAAAHAAPLAPGFDGRSVAADGFHPDLAGYGELAAGVARALA